MKHDFLSGIVVGVLYAYFAIRVGWTMWLLGATLVLAVILFTWDFAA